MGIEFERKASEIFPKSKGGTLSAMQVSPKSFHFGTQNKGETVFLLTRAAAITNFGWIVATLLLSIFPFIAGSLITGALLFFRIDVTDIITRPLFVPVSLFIYFILVGTYAFSAFTKWYFNIYIVTSERILDYDYVPFGKYKISEASLKNIEDVTQRQIGVFPNIFNYGDIIIQTAGERTQFHFDKTPNPSYLRDKITDLADILKQGNSND